jgi:hypothetical protein
MKTVGEIRAEEKSAHEAYEHTTVVHPNGWTIADLRQAFDRVQNPTGWKGPFRAWVHHTRVMITLAAVEFFHADRPTISGEVSADGFVHMEGRGYQAD